MAAIPDRNSKRWEGMKKWIVGLTGVLLVIPALINAGFDIYGAILKVPRTESERINAELFQKYFNKSPLVSFPIPVKQKIGTTEVKFSVFEEGDVFVEYGALTQWFPFPRSSEHPRHAQLSIISPAHADDVAKVRGIGEYKQAEKIERGTLLRKRSYANGVVESSRIDTRTGSVLDKAVSGTASNNAAKSKELAQFGAIDIEALKQQSNAAIGTQATFCTTAVGSCTLPSAVTKGATCFCLNIAGTVQGVAQ